MSRVPIASQSLGAHFAGPTVATRYAPSLIPQGVSAELIASRWGFSRARLDEFAAASHERAARAWKDGLFDGEVAPVSTLAVDETIRPTTSVEELAGQPAAFADDAWSKRFPEIERKVTAGNSSPSTTAPRPS